MVGRVFRREAQIHGRWVAIRWGLWGRAVIAGSANSDPVVQRYNGPVMETLEEVQALIEELRAEYAAQEGLAWVGSSPGEDRLSTRGHETPTLLGGRWRVPRQRDVWSLEGRIHHVIARKERSLS